MSTKIYGASDDLIEFEGDVRGEVGCYGTDEQEHGVLVFCSDGTVLEVKYGKNNKGMWGITLHKRGSSFDRIDQATDEDDNYSDVAYFNKALIWAYAATSAWEEVH